MHEALVEAVELLSQNIDAQAPHNKGLEETQNSETALILLEIDVLLRSGSTQVQVL